MDRTVRDEMDSCYLYSEQGNVFPITDFIDGTVYFFLQRITKSNDFETKINFQQISSRPSFDKLFGWGDFSSFPECEH